MSEGRKLYMNEYSSKLFEDCSCITVDNDFLSNAPENAWCFVEVSDIGPFLDKLRRVVIYRWNRHYPGDKTFPRRELEDRWILESSREFSGSSHDVITEEVYSV
jgi:hypothetical protein